MYNKEKENKIVKKAIRKKIILSLIACSIPILLVGCPILFLVGNFSMVIPSAEVEEIDEYKSISNITGIEWVDMIVYDTVRYENDFAEADPSDTAFDFFTVDYTKREEKEKCIAKNDEGECTEVETYWEIVEEKTLKDKEQILKQLKKLGYNTNDWTVIGAFNTLKNLDKGEEYIINFVYKDIEDLMVNFNEDQREWANMLISDNVIYDLYGDIFDLPTHIATVRDSFFTWPTPDLRTITSPYGWRTHPVNEERAFHYGLDIAGDNAMGKPIIAIADGEVIQVNRSNNLAGNNIRIRHIDKEGNEWQSRYSHMSQMVVVVGQTVEQGDVIGAVGNTGRSTGPHLHLELKFEGQLIDPYSYIQN